MMIFVGSDNPVKINAVKQAIKDKLPQTKVIGFSVLSGVSGQPMSDEETFAGARERAKQALSLGLATTSGQDNLGVGLEGGVFFKQDSQMWATVWAVVVDQLGREFSANGARVKVPLEIADKIKAGQEMGEVMGELVQDKEVKKKAGMIGVITKNFVDRTQEYHNLAKLALGLWYGKDWIECLPKAN